MFSVQPKQGEKRKSIRFECNENKSFMGVLTKSFVPLGIFLCEVLTVFLMTPAKICMGKWVMDKVGKWPN